MARQKVPAHHRSSSNKKHQAEKLEQVLRQAVPQDTPGVALLVMHGDKPTLLRGYGNARIRDIKNEIENRKVTKHTVFDLGSLSKQFTALAILMLIDGSTRNGPDDGRYERLGFRTRLFKFFPKLPGAKRITIRNLLNHSSGLPDYLNLRIGRPGDTRRKRDKKFKKYYSHELSATGYWYATMRGKRDYMKNKDVIALLATRRRLDFPPGTRFVYSDTGYVVLAEIVKKITGKRLGQFLKEEVFDRLKMNNTFVYDETYDKLNHGFTKHSLCYRRNKVTYESIESNTVFNYVHGDGNIHASIDDLVKWVRAWNVIDKPWAKRPKLIRTNTFVKLFKPKPKFGLEDKVQFRYSAGFFVYHFKDENVNSYALYHGGDWLGFHSYLMRGCVYKGTTARQFSIIVLSNYSVVSEFDGADAFTIAKDLSGVYWDLDEKYNILKQIPG